MAKKLSGAGKAKTIKEVDKELERVAVGVVNGALSKAREFMIENIRDTLYSQMPPRSYRWSYDFLRAPKIGVADRMRWGVGGTLFLDPSELHEARSTRKGKGWNTHLGFYGERVRDHLVTWLDETGAYNDKYSHDPWGWSESTKDFIETYLGDAAQVGSTIRYSMGEDGHGASGKITIRKKVPMKVKIIN